MPPPLFLLPSPLYFKSFPDAQTVECWTSCFLQASPFSDPLFFFSPPPPPCSHSHSIEALLLFPPPPLACLSLLSRVISFPWRQFCPKKLLRLDWYFKLKCPCLLSDSLGSKPAGKTSYLGAFRRQSWTVNNNDNQKLQCAQKHRLCLAFFKSPSQLNPHFLLWWLQPTQAAVTVKL